MFKRFAKGGIRTLKDNRQEAVVAFCTAAEWKREHADRVTPTRPCTVQGHPAFFHRWVTEDRGLLRVHAMTNPEQQQALHAYYVKHGIIPSSGSLEKLTETLALVEMPDGSVKKVPAIQIRFTDREG